MCVCLIGGFSVFVLGRESLPHSAGKDPLPRDTIPGECGQRLYSKAAPSQAEALLWELCTLYPLHSIVLQQDVCVI